MRGADSVSRQDANQIDEVDPRHRQAVDELSVLIATRYPTTTFTVRRGIDDPEATYLVATVDVDDPDEVLDLVVERLLTLQVDEGIPVYVLPVHTPARVSRTITQLRQDIPSAAPARLLASE